jgi:CHASE2 domain-containing sensor protein
MPLKSLTFLILAAILAAFLGWQQSRHAFDPIDNGFLAWLQANSNHSAATAPPRPVILVRLDDEERQTFEDWPLTRLDYAVVLSNLKQRQPALVAVAPALYWPQEDEFGTGLLRSHLEAFPAVVLGHRLAMAENRKNLPQNLSPISQVAGDLSGIPAFSSIQLGPEPGLAQSGPAGFTHPSILSLPGDPDTTVALVAKLGGDVIPSLPLQLISASLNSTPGEASLRVDNQSHIKIARLTIPINASGGFTLTPDSTPPLIRLDAETLIDAAQAGIVLENLDPAQRDALNQIENALVIIGDDSPAARIHQLPGGTRISTAELLANVTASILSRGRKAARAWPPLAQYLLWAILIALGAWLMPYPKRRILFCAGIAFTVYIAAALLIFQSTPSYASYASPVPPITLIALIALWGILFPPPKTSPEKE